MSVPYLPEWVLDLVNAVEQFEETHAKADDCLVEALNAVPADVRDFVQGYARGKALAAKGGERS